TWIEFSARYIARPELERFASFKNDLWLRGLIIRSPQVPCGKNLLRIYDQKLQKRIEMVADFGDGRIDVNGTEYPARPIEVVRIWDGESESGELREHALSANPLLLPPPTW